MKKIVLSLAGVLAAAAFAPEASAIPAFARQTGLACSSCHFQHFPVLSTTGQEFKAGGYTQQSAKGKFKGEDLNIPDQLNAAVLLKARYQKTNGTVPSTEISGTTTNSGQWQIPDELSLFFGGRVGENNMFKIGMMMENNLVGGPAGGIIAGMKVPVVITAVDAANIMVIPYLTDSLGQAYGYEQGSGGMTRGVRFAEHRVETMAAQYTGVGAGAASGIAYVLHSDIGYINYSRWAPNFSYGGKAAVQMTSSWLRIAATPTVADWSLHIALGIANGSNFCNALGTAPSGANRCDTKGNSFDVQAQGEVAGMETSFYFATSKADKSTATSNNTFNPSTANDLKATSVAADFSVIPHTLHVGAAYLKGKVADTAGSKDDAITLMAVYDLFQNVALHANYTKFSGPAYDVAGAANSKLTLMLESAW